MAIDNKIEQAMVSSESTQNHFQSKVFLTFFRHTATNLYKIPINAGTFRRKIASKIRIKFKNSAQILKYFPKIFLSDVDELSAKDYEDVIGRSGDTWLYD